MSKCHIVGNLMHWLIALNDHGRTDSHSDYNATCGSCNNQRKISCNNVLLDFSLTVKAATLIFISGRGSAISSAKEGK